MFTNNPKFDAAITDYIQKQTIRIAAKKPFSPEKFEHYIVDLFTGYRIKNFIVLLDQHSEDFDMVYVAFKIQETDRQYTIAALADMKKSELLRVVSFRIRNAKDEFNLYPYGGMIIYESQRKE